MEDKDTKAVPTDEKTWWTSKDDLEPLMGVPGVTGGMMPVPLVDERPETPEPGVEPEQEEPENEADFEPRSWETLES